MASICTWCCRSGSSPDALNAAVEVFLGPPLAHRCPARGEALREAGGRPPQTAGGAPRGGGPGAPAQALRGSGLAPLRPPTARARQRRKRRWILTAADVRAARALSLQAALRARRPRTRACSQTAAARIRLNLVLASLHRAAAWMTTPPACTSPRRASSRAKALDRISTFVLPMSASPLEPPASALARIALAQTQRSSCGSSDHLGRLPHPTARPSGHASAAYRSTKAESGLRWGYPSCRICTVSRSPLYLHCLNTDWLSKVCGWSGRFGLTQRT
mmetsp:Transcript_8752/g.27813  ORF Transcript_8752/g.27813 Transcript_8752/m.27813 type:complete len:275 (+) Transcript_8752:823-1647(+)